MSDSPKIVRLDEFKARRDRQDAAGGGAQRVPEAPLAEARALTPQEVAHRFVMLAFLRQAR